MSPVMSSFCLSADRHRNISGISSFLQLFQEKKFNIDGNSTYS